MAPPSPQVQGGHRINKHRLATLMNGKPVVLAPRKVGCFLRLVNTKWPCKYQEKRQIIKVAKKGRSLKRSTRKWQFTLTSLFSNSRVFLFFLSRKKNGTSYRSLANIQWHLKQFLSVFSFSYLNLLFVKNVLKAEEGAVNCWVSVIGLCVNKGVLIPQILITK